MFDRHKAKAVLDVASSVAVIAAAAVLIWSVVGRPGTTSASNSAAARGDTLTDTHIPAEAARHVQGTGAQVIVEFSDYQCPFCASFAQSTLPEAERELISSGKARYITFHYPLEATHPLAMKASEAVECASQQGKHWDMHKRLFANQAALSPEALLAHADALQLNRSQFEECFAGDATNIVKADMAQGRRLGVTATPTFFLGSVAENGDIRLEKRITGSISFTQLRAELSTLKEVTQ